MNAENFIPFFTFFIALVVIYILIHLVHFRFFTPKLVLRASVMDSLLTILLSPLLYKICSIFLLEISIIQVFIAVIIFFQLSVIYSILGPNMLDRSLSVPMIIILQKKGKIQEREFYKYKDINIETLVKKRIEDCIKSGNLTKEGGDLRITKKGTFVANVFWLLSRILNIKVKY